VKISALRILFHKHLLPLYEQREIDSIFFKYINDIYNIEKHHFFLYPESETETLKENSELLPLSSIDDRANLQLLAKGYPIQYVTGKTIFYKLLLKLNPSVLIPRPETEELVDIIIDDHKTNRDNFYKILDIGTGSGAIAIALAKNMKKISIYATDISEEALHTAKINAARNNVKISFLHHDILKDDHNMLPAEIDIIVSNPPYIPLGERKYLHENIGFEPDKALFVPDEDPLIFYHAIAEVAKKKLRNGGVLYFETHEKFHCNLSAILNEKGFKEIELLNDLNQKPRFVKGKKL